MKPLVTGGAGYIGSVVAKQLLDAGHEVVVLDDLSRGHRRGDPARRGPREVALLDAHALRDALAGGFDGVLHFAALALVAESVAHPERYWRNNVGGTLNLLDAMRAHGVGRLVFSSTVRHLRRAGDRPDHRGRADRAGQRLRRLQARRRPHDPRRVPRARPRRRLAALLQRRRRERRAGRGPRPRDAPDPARPPGRGRPARGTSASSGRTTRHPRRDRGARLHPRRGPRRRAPAARSTRSSPARHRVFNLGTGDGYTVREVIEAARRVTGREIPVARRPRRAGDPPRARRGHARAREELGWAPTPRRWTR